MTSKYDVNNDDRYPFFCSIRFLLAITGLFMFMHMYAQRVGMSVAIVCMVNHTAVERLKAEEDERIANATHYTARLEANATLEGGGEAEPHLRDVSMCLRETSNETVSPISDGPFVWEKSIQGHLLGAFFYGYMLSQIPGGLLAEQFGGKWVVFGFLGLSTLGTIFTPLAAKSSLAALIFLRILAGIGSGAIFPAMHAWWGQWAPPMERSKLTSLTYAGAMLGTVITMPVSGLLCQYGFDGGWGSIFYCIGLSSTVCLALWALFASNTPATNRFMSDAEKKYITHSLEGEVSEESPSCRQVPWLKMATSGPVWAIIAVNFCMDWGFYTLLTNIPTFYKEVLYFDIASNGLYSALPFLAMWLNMNTSPYLADYLRSSKILSTLTTRKLFNSLGLFGAALSLIGLSFLDCTQTGLAIALLTLAVAVNGFMFSGFFVNHMDIAPKYAGTLMGISNGVAATSGFFAPWVAATLTIDQSRESWQIVFFISAGIYCFGAVVFLVLGAATIQPWAMDSSIANAHEMSVNMDPPTKNVD